MNLDCSAPAEQPPEVTKIDLKRNNVELSHIKDGKMAAVAVASRQETVYISYSQRWWLVASVALLNIANNAHWISFASVHSKAAVFYQVIRRMLEQMHQSSSSLPVTVEDFSAHCVVSKRLNQRTLT